MKLEKFLLHRFSEEKPPELLHLDIPTYSMFCKAIILQDGIYMIYSVPEVASNTTRIDTYTIIKTGVSIPIGATMIDILDNWFEIDDRPGEQGVVIFPIFKIN